VTDCGSIRPLSSSEVKQRGLSGRTQISVAGRKLLDGTPFGRPHIRPASDRPRLLIPSAKRRRAGKGVEASTLQSANGVEDDEDDDEDYEPEDEEELPTNSRNALARFASTDILDSDEEDDSDFNLHSSASAAYSSSESSSSASDEHGSSSDESSEDNVPEA
jgi:hypothetical protein